MEDENMPTPLDNRKFNKGFLIICSVLSIIVGVCVIIYFITIVTDSHTIPKQGEILNLTSFGAFGDFISGVAGTLFSLGGFFLLYITLKDQRENFHRERLESNYFEMISFHRDNVNELKYTYYEASKTNSVTAEKRKVFKIIFAQFKEAWEELSHFFNENEIDDIYNPNYLIEIKKNSTIIDRKINLKQYAQIDIIYSIVFFGLSQEDREIIVNILKKKYNETFTKKLIDYAVLKPKKESHFWDQWQFINTYDNKIEIFNEIVKKRNDDTYISPLKLNQKMGDQTLPYDPFYVDNYHKYYGGHQFRLGHYFRHLFQTIKFIDNEVYLSFNEKYNYIKILRSQLSNYEQIVFFLSSVSEVGRTWEFETKNRKQKIIEDNKQLITKYNLIKNIPMEIIAKEIFISNYYPNVIFETINNEHRINNKELLIKKYN